jgi:deoxyribonuclease-4
MFGSHLSIGGPQGMSGAVREALRLGLDCVQVFTKNQQQWKAPPLSSSAISMWNDAIGEAGWAAPVDGRPRVVSHASYLANMGSPVGELWEKSVGLMREEIERCETLKIGLLVFHPGSSTGSPREEGAERIARGVARLLHETRGYRTVLCLENVAGAGSTLGRTFEELASLRSRIVELAGEMGVDRGEAQARVGFCLDTCHMHAAGYDLAGGNDGGAAALRQVRAVLGIENVRCLHLNDSKGVAGSRLDRHEHIGEGTIGLKGFEAFLRDEVLNGVPKIMETPKGETNAGEAFDTINVSRLRAIARGEIASVAIVAMSEKKDAGGTKARSREEGRAKSVSTKGGKGGKGKKKVVGGELRSAKSGVKSKTGKKVVKKRG